jgi:hypothetical protein
MAIAERGQGAQELGVYKAARPGPSQSFTGLPAHHTQTKHEGLCEYFGITVGVPGARAQSFESCAARVRLRGEHSLLCTGG